MDRFDDHSRTALELRASELFMALHRDPENPQVREALLLWIRESEEHWQAFQALSLYFDEISRLLEGGDPDNP